MSTSPAHRETMAVLAPGQTYASVTDKISSIVQAPPPKVMLIWWAAFGVMSLLTLLLVIASVAVIGVGVGIWGINMPVAWGFAISNFVWWIGIGHAGTFISAFLLLMRQQWRTSINRFAEAMTLFAVMCAGLFPLLHMGRQWYFYWLVPYPNTMAMWPQFRSPLVWDVFAVSTYFTISLLFWYVGLLPDLATLRDRSRTRIGQILYGVFALGWRGSALHWQRYRIAYLLLAGLATPLVISVHSVVSLDFTVAQLPGWHSTIFPPYFVAGAIFSGFAMVLTLAIPMRLAFGLQGLITLRHLDNCAKLTLVTGLIVAYGYAMEGFMAWYSGDPYERFQMLNRMLGPYGFAWALTIFCNVLAPQALWLRRVRTSPAMLLVVALVIQVGMWMERFMIVVQSLSRDWLPSSWHMYYPTFWDWATFLGTIGLFGWFFLLFVRFVPSISITEVRELVHERRHHGNQPAGPGK